MLRDAPAAAPPGPAEPEAPDAPDGLRARLGDGRGDAPPRVRAGLKKNLIKQTAGLGDRICIAWPGLTSIPYQGLGKGRRIRITDEDLETVRPRVDGLKRMSSEYSDGWKMVYNLKTYPVDVSGVSPEFAEMRNLIPDPGGRFLNPLDMQDQRRVVFLGDKVAEDIFGKGTDPVGKTVLFNGSPFLVIGVLQAKEQDSSYNSRDSDLAWIPGTTFRALTGRKYLSNFVFQPASALESKAVTESLRAALVAPPASSTPKTRRPSRSGTRPSSSSSSRSSCSPSRSSSGSSGR